MHKITVRSQDELNAATFEFPHKKTKIVIDTPSDEHINLSTFKKNLTIEAVGESNIIATDSILLTARDNVRVEAYYNSCIVARDNATVRAYDMSKVIARDKSFVTLIQGNVKAFNHARIHSDYDGKYYIYSSKVKVTGSGYGERFYTKENPTIINGSFLSLKSNQVWLENYYVKEDNGFVILYKRVSANFKTQMGTPQETDWEIGKTLIHPFWFPEAEECGSGKFHACDTPRSCDEFCYGCNDKYIAIKIHTSDLFSWGNMISWSIGWANYPSKIAFRKGTVLYECDNEGKKIEHT